MFKGILLAVNEIDTATQAAAQAVESGVTEEKLSLWNMAMHGGWIMWVLLALLVLSPSTAL